MPGLYTFTGDPDEVWQNWVVRLEDGGPVVGYVQATRHLSAGSAELAWGVGAAPCTTGAQRCRTRGILRPWQR